MATRRDALAAVIGDELDGIVGKDSEANGPGFQAEDGFPFELLSGSGIKTDDNDPIPTRVKMSSAKKEDKPPKQPRGTAAERQLADIGENLEEKIAQFAMLASGIAPVTSVYAAENSPKAVSALLSIAKRRPKVLAALSKVADGVDVLELAKFVGGLVVAIQVDAQRLKGDELPAQAFGVTAILQEFFWTDQQTAVNPAMEMQVPRYAPVA